ncbi:Uncharacterised protein [Mycobacteroides abscessus subsp. abscessus]|nr:Uncharacterised protein [Mycobacteroides abscessus subsp. abscessus]
MVMAGTSTTSSGKAVLPARGTAAGVSPRRSLSRACLRPSFTAATSARATWGTSRAVCRASCPSARSLLRDNGNG